MNSFYFSMVEPQEPRNDNQGPPVEKFTEFVTLKELPGAHNEVLRMHDYIESSMRIVPHHIHSESDFDYMYENEPNHIRELRRAWVCEVDFRGKTGKPSRKAFIFRFLPTPLYEIEKQKEYDDMLMKRAEKMKVQEIQAKKDVLASQEKKVAKELSEDEALRSYQRAKMMAEKNYTLPPTMDNTDFAEPMVIPLTEEDKINEEREKKDAKDAKKKEQEMQMLNSFLRNKERVKGLKPPHPDSAP